MLGVCSHWLCRRCLGINLDEDVEGDRQHAVGFSFGAAHAWERFTVSPFVDPTGFPTGHKARYHNKTGTHLPLCIYVTCTYIHLHIGCMHIAHQTSKCAATSVQSLECLDSRTSMYSHRTRQPSMRVWCMPCCICTERYFSVSRVCIAGVLCLYRWISFCLVSCGTLSSCNSTL